VRRRLLAAFAALVLALVGTVVLVAYVRGADTRALAGVQTVDVLVVQQPVPAGTPAAELAGLVGVEPVPVKAAVPGRVTDLADVAGQVTTVELEPGEQLLAARFAGPDDQLAPGTVAVPAGAQEISVLLEPQRAVGGRLAAGDTVGVFISQEGSTHVVLHRVLVTQVQGAPAQAEASEDVETASAGSAAPAASLMVTLALTAEQAEGVVFGAEHGTLWLSLEPEGADIDGTEVITPDTVYGKDYS
jgi:pilus assembly protein CpaB